MKMQEVTRRQRLAGSMALMTAMFLLCLSGTVSMAQEEATSAPAIEKLLPPETVFFCGMEDMALAEKNYKSMPIYKILQEEEVIDFLKQPTEFVKGIFAKIQEEAAKDETFKKLNFNFEDLLNVEVGQFFIAVTHVTIPDFSNPETSIPDVGLVIGAEFKNQELNLIKLAKHAIITIAADNGMPITLAQEEYNGVAFEKMILPIPVPISPCFFKIGNTDIVSLSTNSMKGMIDRMLGKEGRSLAGLSEYARVAKNMHFADPAVSKFYMNFDHIFSLAKSGISIALQMNGKMDFVPKVEKAFEISGLECFKALYTSSLSRDGLASSWTYVAVDGPQKGLLALSPNKPISRDKLKMIPKDAVSFNITQFNLAPLYDLTMECINIFDESVYGEVQQAIKGVEAMLGGEAGELSFRDDLLAPLGPEFVGYNMESQGMAMMMGGMPPIFWFVEVQNIDRFLQKLELTINGLTGINPEIGSFLALKNLEYEGRKIYYFQFQQIPITFQPAFTQVDKYVVFSLQVNDLKKLIKQFGNEGNPCALENPEVKKYLAMLPEGKDLLSISYNNVPVSFGSTYEQITPVIPMILATMPMEIELPLNFSLLPTSEAITKHLFGSFTASFEEEGGYMVVHYGPIGSEVTRFILPVAAMGAAMFISLVGSDVIETEAFIDETEMTEVVEEIPHDVQARKDLGALAGACFVYKVEHGGFPDSLKALLEPTDNYPHGFYPQSDLPMDPWGNAYRYKKFQGGANQYMIWSCGPNGIDENGAGDDIKKVK